MNLQTITLGSASPSPHRALPQRACILALLGTLAACGGGSGSSSDTLAGAGENTGVTNTASTVDNRSLSDTGAADTSNASPTTGSASVPPAPTGLVASLDRAAGVITLNWTPLADPAAAYRVYWAQGALPDSASSLAVDVYTASYTHSGLLEGATYAFRVSAWLNGAESGLSPAVTVSNTTATPSLPARGSDTGL
ncbi:MAG: fibronectin type III domain-containing protein [Thiothrix sp.]